MGRSNLKYNQYHKKHRGGKAGEKEKQLHSHYASTTGSHLPPQPLPDDNQFGRNDEDALQVRSEFYNWITLLFSSHSFFV